MIRTASVKDLNSIKLLGTSFMPLFAKTYDLDGYIKNDKYIVLVNEDNETVDGFLIVFKNIDCYEIEFIIVDESKRHKHIATNILNYFFEHFTKTGDVILLEVASNNDKAINLYKKFAFETINIRKKYYNGIDAYVMKKVVK